MLDHTRRLADGVLAPAAEDVDRAATLPPGHVRALAEAGLWGLVGPADLSTTPVDPADRRRVMATVAGGCGATFFVWAQHHGVVLSFARAAALADADACTATRSEAADAEPLDAAQRDGDRLGGMDPDRIHSTLAALCAGDLVAGTTFAFLRNPQAPGVRADRVDGGWSLRGVAPWLTSWGIASDFLFASTTEDRRIVWAFVEAGPDRPVDGLTPGHLDLAVFGATGSVSLRFDDVFVADSDVLFTESLSAWRIADRIRAAPGQPATLGLAERCAVHLRSSDDADSVAAADAVDAALAARWEDDDRILAEVPSITADDFARPGAADDFVVAASRHRARCLDLARTASLAYLAASGGRGMGLDHPAQRLVRESAFWVIQGQTPDGRAGALQHAAASL